MSAIQSVDYVDEERRNSGADWRFICCSGAFRIAPSVAAAASRPGMQNVVARDEVRVGKEEQNECVRWAHRENKIG